MHCRRSFGDILQMKQNIKKVCLLTRKANKLKPLFCIILIIRYDLLVNPKEVNQ